MKNKNMYIFLGIILLTSLVISPKIAEGLSFKKRCRKKCRKKDKDYEYDRKDKLCECKEKKKKESSGSFICTALYKNNHISKDDYRLMTLFGVLAVKAKKYEKDMMLYFTCMKHLMPYVEKKEKENKQFWNNLKIFFVCCIKNLKEKKYDNVIKLFTIKSISMAEKYSGGLKNIPNLSKKNYNLYKTIYKKNKEKYNITCKSFSKLI
tara:strand:- start:548 stop:1168 length:621 start_codon:yes stop_codon:yes gene_type:complete